MAIKKASDWCERWFLCFGVVAHLAGGVLLVIAAILALLLLIPGAAEAQVQPTPPPVTYDDVFRTLTRDAFQMVQVEIGTQRFRLDLSATKKGANGMTALESVKLSIAAATPAEWDTEVRKQLPAKVKALVKKVTSATVIGNPTSAPSNPDTLTVIDELRGIVFQTKHGEPGVTGKRSLTLAVLVGR